MVRLMLDDANHYRDRAEHCRRLARIVLDQKISAELLKISGEFEAEACELEAAQATFHQGPLAEPDLAAERKV